MLLIDCFIRYYVIIALICYSKEINIEIYNIYK